MSLSEALVQDSRCVNAIYFMKSKLPVLEYSVVGRTPGKRGKWTFRFRTPEGGVLIESGAKFSTKAEAERGFVSLIKSVASNEYQVDYPKVPRDANKLAHSLNGRCGLKGRRGILSGVGSHR
jgi:uncharacterized protein YegP (UPF0339 family)